jgi:hypothetical protein
MKRKNSRTRKTSKRVIRFRMKNLSYLAHHPDRRCVKVSQENGDYFPESILNEKNPVTRDEKKKVYMELRHSLQLQKKRGNCQSEPNILKLSKSLGLFPEDYERQDDEARAWETVWAAHCEKREAKKCRHAIRRMKKKGLLKPMLYTDYLRAQAKAGGFKSAAVKRKAVRKHAIVRTTFRVAVKTKNGEIKMNRFGLPVYRRVMQTVH